MPQSISPVRMNHINMVLADFDASIAHFRDLYLIAPDGSGPIRWHLDRYGPGIRSTVLGVRDPDQARGYFAGRSIAVVPGDRPDAIAVPADTNMGIILEFAA